MKNLLWIFALFLFSPAWSQEDSLMKAWGVYEKIHNKTVTAADTSLVLKIEEACGDIIVTQPHEAIHRAHLMLKLAQMINFPKGIAGGLLQLSNTHLNVQHLDSAQYYVDRAIRYCENNNRHRQLMVATGIRGNLHYYRSEYNEALTDYFASIKIADEFYPEESGAKYANVGLVFWTIGNYEKSQTYLEKSYKLSQIYQDTSTQIYALNNLGITSRNQGKLEEAKKYYEEGLELAILTGELRREGEFVYNLANVYFDENRHEEGFKLLERSAEITELIGTDRDKALEYSNMGQHLFEVGNYARAYKYCKEGLFYAQKTSYWEAEMEALEVLAYSSYRMGNYKEAFEFSRELIFLQDSLDLKSINNQALAIEEAHQQEQEALKDSLLQEKHELEKIHQKNLNDQKVKSRENLLYVAIAVIALVIFGLIFLYRTNQKVKQKNEIITQRNNLITLQKEEIEEAHKEITDSINYAQRIQNALISGNEEWDKISMDHYILFKPKDVVSGDFYWAYHAEAENTSIWVTADCTGHGVPGAFMSMLGISFLNEIIIENGNRNGGKILDLLRSKIVKALTQKNTEQQQRDGMDLSLCIWNKNTNMLEFTGANNGLYVIRKTDDIDPTKFEKCISNQDNGYSLIELKTNKMPVGFQSDKQGVFESTEFRLNSGDLLVSFTDGYADQFGGEKGKKLKSKPFKELLLDIHTRPVKLHANILNDAFVQWKNDLEQVDDVCVIGVRV